MVGDVFVDGLTKSGVVPNLVRSYFKHLHGIGYAVPMQLSTSGFLLTWHTSLKGHNRTVNKSLFLFPLPS